MKEQWFRNFERALNEREAAGFSRKSAYELAAHDANENTAPSIIEQADTLRKESK